MQSAEAALLQLHAFSAADSHLAIPPHLSLTLLLAAVPACREECAPQLARLPLASVLTLVSCGRTSPSTASSSPHTRASLSLPLHPLSPPTPLPSRLRLARCHPHVSGPEPSQMQLQVPDTQREREWTLRLSDDLVAEASRWHRAAWLCRPAGAMYIVRRQAHASRLRLSSSPQQGRDAGGYLAALREHDGRVRRLGQHDHALPGPARQQGTPVLATHARTHRVVRVREARVQAPLVRAHERRDDRAELQVGKLLADAAVAGDTQSASAGRIAVPVSCSALTGQRQRAGTGCWRRSRWRPSRSRPSRPAPRAQSRPCRASGLGQTSRCRARSWGPPG